uniref:Uncharacterized protein n=1 Tax=Ixodes ricinus TaxID=34613 RepID=A0A6B0UYT7_IXORI
MAVILAEFWSSSTWPTAAPFLRCCVLFLEFVTSTRVRPSCSSATPLAPPIPLPRSNWRLPSSSISPRKASVIPTGPETLDRGGNFTWLARTRTADNVALGFSGGETGFRSVNRFAPRSMTAPYSQRKFIPRITSLSQSCRTTNFTGHVSPWASTRAVHLSICVMRCPPVVCI